MYNMFVLGRQRRLCGSSLLGSCVLRSITSIDSFLRHFDPGASSRKEEGVIKAKTKCREEKIDKGLTFSFRVFSNIYEVNLTIFSSYANVFFTLDNRFFFNILFHTSPLHSFTLYFSFLLTYLFLLQEIVTVLLFAEEQSLLKIYK